MIVYEFINNNIVEKRVSKDDAKGIVDMISSKWTKWSTVLKDVKARRNGVIERSKPKLCNAKKSEEDWKSNIELNRPYEYYNKLYGLLYETFYDKIPSFLKMGKEIYDRVYNRAFTIENKKTLLVCLKDMLESGEIVASAELQNTYEKQVVSLEEIQMNPEFDPSSIVSVRANHVVVKQKTGDKINFIRINPCNFAYDPLVEPGTEDFDNCDKIVKQWKTRHEILSNANYEITSDQLDEILREDAQDVANDESDDKNDVDTTVRSSQIEVLTYYGGVTIKGKYYANYVAVVIGRRFLAYFKPKGIYTPGIYYYPFHSIGDGSRGVSPLYYILDLCAAEQKALNDSIDFLELQKNPPLYAPVNFFEEEVTKIQPGGHITYKPGMQDPSAIIPIRFDAPQYLQVFQETTKQLEKEIAGIDNGQLSVKSEALTEEEVKRIASSENLIPNMIISGILLNIIAKYLKDCVEMETQQEFSGNVVKTAWEYANEQLQMQNVVNVLDKIGSSDPTMINMQNSAVKVFESLGVNANDYLNDSKSQMIVQEFGNMDEDILQQLVQVAQALQVQKNNQEKAAKMMGQLQDDEYRRQLRESWKNTGSMPGEVIVPNGQGTMSVPVVSVTPEAQTVNRTSTTAD